MDILQDLPEQVEEFSPMPLEDVPSVEIYPYVKSDDVVYSSLLAEGNPIDNWKSAKEEISRTGTSSLVEQETSKWQEENQTQNLKTVESILLDSSITTEQKKSVIDVYKQGTKSIEDIRTKYLLKQAAVDNSITEEDKIAQDLYSQIVFNRDRNKKQEEAVKHIDNTAVTIADIFKGAGAVASGIALSIPAGLAGAFSWMLDNDVGKANEVIKDIQEYAYKPTEAGSQKVVNKIQSFMELIDVPFQYIGDKTLEFTSNPLAATIAYTGTSFVGYLGAGKALSKGYKAVSKGKSSLDSTSPIATAETANPKAAAEMVSMGISSPEAAEALRAKQDALLNNYVLPKLEEEFGVIRPDAIETIKKHDQILNDIYNKTELDPNVAPVTKITSDRDKYLAIMTEESGPRLNLPSSMLETGVDGLRGKATFGRNDIYGYSTELAAETAMQQLKDSAAHLPDQGKFSIRKVEDQYFVDWEFSTKNPDYAEHLAFGTDALSAHVISPRWDITWFANSVVGDKIWPAYMRMKEWVPSTGATTAWKQGYIEGKFLNAQRELFMGTKHPKELISMLRLGEQEGKTYTVSDFQARNQHLTKAENEKLHAEYAGYRRIQDHLYRFSDRSFRQKLDRDGFKSFYDGSGNRIGFAKLEENPVNASKVWDVVKQQAVDKPSTLPIVRLQSPVRHGNDIYEYAVLDKGFRLEPNSAGSLTKIPGYIARYYKEWFVLDKIPKVVSVNGFKVAEENLRNYKGSVAMGATRKEIEALKKRFEENDPNNSYEWRREEKDIADKIIHDSHIYDTYLKEIHSRGERLPAFGREAEIEDILVSQTRSIQTITKVAAWDQINAEAKKQWVKAYGKFSEGKFPDEINGIVPKRRMTDQEAHEFKAAQKIYQQFEMQQYTRLPSDELWKSTLNTIADIFEKVDIPSSLLREMSQKGNLPIRMAKAFGSNLWLYLRPLRMWAVQPQQWKELMFMDKSFASSAKQIPAIWMGLITRTKTLNSLQGIADSAGRRLIKDYDAMVTAMEESGIMQAVDMNQMIHGLWKDTLQEISPKDIGTVKGAVKAIGEGTGKAISLPSKVGRALGYDASELMNQVSLWVFAKHRWETKNPGKNWNTPENKAQIAQDQARYGHMASTRAGMYSWQEGTLSMFTQFAAIPFKSMMQMISAKEFTTGEKARLAAARFFWYGKYGIPLGATIYSLLERNIDNEEDRALLDNWTQGMTNVVGNSVLGAMFDDKNLGENTKADFSKSLSTIPENIWFWDFGKTLYDMARGDKPEQKFPFITAGSAVYKMTETLYDMFTIPPKAGNERDFSNMAWKAVSFAGQFNDYAKYKLEDQLSKNGHNLGYKQTAGEAIARLIGVGPQGERIMYDVLKLEQNRDKYIKETAKDIHSRLMELQKAKTPEEIADYSRFDSELKAFLGSVDEVYAREIIDEVFKLDRSVHLTMKQSIMSNYFKKYNSTLDSYMLDARNKMEKSTDPEMKALIKDINNAMQGNK